MSKSTVGYTGLHIEYDADVHVSAALRSHGYYVIAVAEGAACDAVATGRGNCDFGDYTLFCMSPVAMASALVGTVAMPRTLRMLVAFNPTLLACVPHESDAPNYTFFGYSPHEALHMSVAEYGIMSGCVGDIVGELPHENDSYKGRDSGSACYPYSGLCAAFLRPAVRHARGGVQGGCRILSRLDG